MVEAALTQFGRLDFLDNNVGIASTGSVVEEDPQRWRRLMQVNVDSMFLASRHAIPAMIRTAGGGAIVNIASIAALRPRGMTAYSVSKGAVIALTRAMAVDHGPDGIRVNCVAPGPVYTPMVTAAGMSEAARERRRKASVLGIEGTGWDVGLRCALPALESGPLHHGTDPGGRWRRHAGRPRTRDRVSVARCVKHACCKLRRAKRPPIASTAAATARAPERRRPGGSRPSRPR